MKKLLLYLSALLIAPLAIATNTSYSPPVGGMTIPSAASTDSFVSVGLARSAVWVGTVASVTGNSITVSGAPGWLVNGFAPTSYHYARMLSGTHRGHFFTIISNTADTITVDSAGLALSSLAVSDQLEIVPHWTLGTLYPASQAGSAFVTTTSTLSRQTEILFFDATATGTNRAASAIYFFYNGAWRKVGSSVLTSFDSTIIYPDTYFMQRNKGATTALIHTGRVQPAYLSTILEAATTKNDNFVALAFPVNVTLNGSGLATSGFTTTTSTLSRKDELLWFDPAATGINRAASAIYFYYNNGWRKVGTSVLTDFGDTVELTAGKGFIIRKAANGITASWTYNTGL